MYRHCQHSFLWKHSGGVPTAGFDITLVFVLALGTCGFLQVCHLVSCPEQVLCPRRSQPNILRQKVETQLPSASPPALPPPVYDVSTRITLHLFCPQHGTTLPFPAMVQTMPVSWCETEAIPPYLLLLVSLPCFASLRTGCVSILVPVMTSPVSKPCPMPCWAAPFPLPAAQSSKCGARKDSWWKR